MRIKKKYTEFIKENNEYIDEKTIKEVFIDLIDMDYTLTFVDGYRAKDKGAKYFIDIRKSVDSKYDYIQNDFSYGVTNLEPIKLDITKVLDILQDAKETLMSMEYTVGYEIEFNFNEQSQFFIACHIQHNDTIEDKDDRLLDIYRRLGDNERLNDEEPRGIDEY
jgi:hypothetical protein